MAQDFSTLYDKFKEIVDSGTEEDARAFLLNHLNEFPEDMRQNIILSLFQQGLQDAAAAATARQEFQQEGIDAIQELETGKRIMDDNQKVFDLQEKM